jgi:gluconokinase
MGVAGAGKTTVGHVVARRLRVPFLDADDYHDPAAIALMRAGKPLDDALRTPWLRRVVEATERLDGRGFVLACSALKRSYREFLRSHIAAAQFVHLSVDEDSLRRRLRGRSGHFASADLLPSQLETLELDDDVVTVSGLGTPSEVATRVLAAIARGPSR